MSIMITGGTGLIGSALARKLAKQGEQVVVFDISPNLRMIDDVKDKVKIIQGDLTIPQEINDAIKLHKVEGIFHLASVISAAAEQRIVSSFNVNFVGTVNVLEAARSFGVKKVIYSSSGAAYGDKEGKRVNEGDPCQPSNPYAIAKYFGERWGVFYHLRHGIDFRALRFPPIIGAGRKAGVMSYMSHMIEKPALGLPYESYVKEETQTAFLYVKDAARALELAYQKESVDDRIYNLNGIILTAKELADLTRARLPEAQISFNPKPELDSRVRAQHRELDDSLAQRVFSWKTEISPSAMVNDLVDEIQANPHLFQ